MKKEELSAEFIGIMLGDGCIGIYDCKAGKNVINCKFAHKKTLKK